MPRSISRMALLFGLLALMAASEGCQRGPTWSLVPVEGTVTKEGRPLSGIEVVFVPDVDTQGPRASGLTDAAGRYRLRTDGGDDGTAAGKHRVLLLDLEAVKGQMGRTIRESQMKEGAPLLPTMAKRLEEQRKKAADAPRLPFSYGHLNDTPLRVEVHSGPQVIDLEVK
jgi:hypothetical protein